jgi:hypothetical protein
MNFRDWKTTLEIANAEAKRTGTRQRVYSEKSFFVDCWFYYYEPIKTTKEEK